MRKSSGPHATSAGHAQSSSLWLDVRYETNRTAYEAQVHAVGLQPGWRVLDAGCGGGAFLPLLVTVVGPHGRVEALDLAPENIAVVNERVVRSGLGAQVTAQIGSVLALPYPSGSFDAVWCANTTQYLSDAELAVALGELRRVVRAGGLVAIKDSDATLNRLLTAPTGLLLRLYQALAGTGAVQPTGTLRTATLPTWLRRLGLAEICRHTTLLEHGQPMLPAMRDQFRNYLAFYAGEAAGVDLPAAHQAFWAQLRSPEGMAAFLDDPDFASCEGSTLAVGRVPAA